MSSPDTTHLLLIRHAESLGNRYGPSLGADSGLTARGWLQAHRLAEWLTDHEPVSIIVSSPLIRARQTADILADTLRRPVVIHPDLGEAEQPYWEELPRFPADRGLPEVSWTPSPEKAPLYTAFRARVVPALRAILDQFWGQHIAIVTHGGTMSTLLRALIGGHHVSVYQDNTAIHKLIWQHERWMLMYANRAEHLNHLLSAPRSNEVPASPPDPDRLLLRNAHPLSHGQLERLERLARPHAADQMLDVAAGSGALTVAWAPRVSHVVAVDTRPALLEQAELARLRAGFTNVYIRWAEARELPFPDDSFDLVTCAYGLHHLQDAPKAIQEMARVCRIGGRVALLDPAGDDDPVKRATQDAIESRRDSSHVRLLTAGQARDLVTAAGLHIERFDVTETEWRLDDWLETANADEDTVEAVTAMVDAAIEGDAAGLQVHRARDGSLAFRQRVTALLAVKPPLA